MFVVLAVVLMTGIDLPIGLWRNGGIVSISSSEAASRCCSPNSARPAAGGGTTRRGAEGDGPGERLLLGPVDVPGTEPGGRAARPGGVARIVLLLAAAFLVAGCAERGAGSPDVVGEWFLVEGSADGLPLPLPAGSAATLTVTPGRN